MSNLKSFVYLMVFGSISSFIVANPPDFNPRAAVLVEKSEAAQPVRK